LTRIPISGIPTAEITHYRKTMIAYREEKIKNAICYFAAEHAKRTKKHLYQTFLYKYLAFLDFESLSDTGHPVLGLKYKAMGRGPVPIEIYDKRKGLKTECFEFKELEDEKFTIIPTGRPNLEYFSSYEIQKMRRLIEIFADVFVKASDMSEASHESIRAWKETWKKNKNGIIDYDDQFSEDIKCKDEKKLTPPEEHYLIYKSLEETRH
jgi:uncharacterized phage-associated protein